MRALEELARQRAIGRAEAARQAIEEAAARGRKTDLKAEARRLMGDPTYVTEAREITELMEELGDPW